MNKITVRYSVASDLSELARLAALDSASPPRGPALIADPFEPTAEILELLRLRAEQVEAGEPNRWRDRVRSLLRARPSHARA